MKSRTLPAIALLLTLNLFAQTQPGIIITGDQSYNTYMSASTIGADHFVYCTGSYLTPSIPEIYLCKTDTLGNIVWEKTISASYALNPLDISADDHSIYITGTTSISGFVMRLDIDGNLLWQKNIQAFGIITGYDVECYTDGGCILAGRYFSQPQVSCGFILRLDSSGNTTWTREIHWNGFPDGMLHGVTSDNMGNIYACGGAGPTAPGQVATITKFSPSGNEIWSYAYGDSSTYITFDHCISAGDGLIVSGYILASPVSYAVVLSVDTAGNFVNGITFYSASEGTSVVHLALSEYNTILASLYVTNSSAECMVLEINSALNVIRGIQSSTMELTGANATDSRIYICGSIGNPSRQYQRAIAGNDWSFGCGFTSAGPVLQSLMLQRSSLTDSSASVVINAAPGTTTSTGISIPYTSCNNLAGIHDPESPAPTVYPTPASDYCTITFLQPSGEPTLFELTDIDGKTIQHCLLIEGKQTLEIYARDLADGMYFLKSENGFVAKIVVAH